MASLQSGLQSGDAVSFDLSIIRVIKGALLPGSVQKIVWTAEVAIPVTRVLPRVTGLWFLVKSATGEMTVLPNAVGSAEFEDTYFAAVDNPEPRLYATTGGESPLEAAMLEIAAAIDAGKRGPGDLRYALSSADPARGAGAYRRLLKSPSLDVRALALAGLVRNNEPDALSQLASLLPELKAKSLSGWIGLSVQLYHSTDDAGVAALGQIASSPDGAGFLAESAALALASIHTRSAVAQLARLLDSSDPRIRSHAVSGISAFVRGLPVRKPRDAASMAWLKPATSSGYLTDEVRPYLSIGILPPDRETETVQFWKGWWERHRQELESSNP
ncbi:MAG: hypothetical protein ACM3S5_02870 [Rhodospirillales bacterium]